MGEYTDSYGRHSFTPDDNENTIYIPYEISIDEILDLAAERFHVFELDKIMISSEYIHTNCPQPSKRG
jgi:hypothetical protein